MQLRSRPAGITTNVRTLKAPYETETIRWKREHVSRTKYNKEFHSHDHECE